VELSTTNLNANIKNIKDLLYFIDLFYRKRRKQITNHEETQQKRKNPKAFT